MISVVLRFQSPEVEERWFVGGGEMVRGLTLGQNQVPYIGLFPQP